MFCDEVKIELTAGNGGKGCIGFRREKFLPKGGPNGGDGGNGGSIFFRANENLNTLSEFRTKKRFSGHDGEMGRGSNEAGKNAEDLFLEVPPGTIITDMSGKKPLFLGDLKTHGEIFVAVSGGRGGYGNAHFATSTRQAPRFAELGEPGQSKKLKLELKLVADVGIIGYPSVGKSTLISRISNAKPKIADYPFTTLVPNLGMVSMASFGGSPKESFVACDLPGLIEGAHKGKGLGITFLRHIMRNRLLVHLIDAASEHPAEDYRVLMTELKKFDKKMAKKPQLVALNKIDTVDESTLKEKQRELIRAIRGIREVYCISAVTGAGIKALAFALWDLLKKEPRPQVPKKNTMKVYRPHLESDPRSCEMKLLKTTKEGKIFSVHGKRLEQIVIMTDFGNEEAVARVYDVIEKMGVARELMRMGAQFGDSILIGSKKIMFRPPL